MGKFATYAKRGSAEAFGSLLAPVDADWSISSPVTNQVRATLITPIPAPATQWGFRLKLPTGTLSNWVVGSGATLNASTAAGLTYTGYIAWFDAAGLQLSPPSPGKTIVST